MKRQNSAATRHSPSRYFSPTQHNYLEIMKQITQNAVNCQKTQLTKKIGTSPNPLNKRIKTQQQASSSRQTAVRVKTASAPKSKLDNFVMMEQLGQGKFGKVFKCQQITSKKYYAIKMINKKQLKKSQMLHQLQREISIHSTLKHPNIIQLHEYFETAEDYCLLLEFATGGTLFNSLMKQPNRRYSEPAASNIIKQVAQAIQFLQKSNIIHRDLKPENILWSDGILKISDFGWSIQDKKERETLCGTLDYLPPEMVYGQQYDNSVDLWSLGVLTYELTTGKTPFEVQEGFQLNFPDHLSGDVKDLMKGLLTDKKSRKSMDWVLNHIWLS